MEKKPHWPVTCWMKIQCRCGWVRGNWRGREWKESSVVQGVRAGSRARDLGVPRRGRGFHPTAVLETGSVYVCISALGGAIEFQATWLIQFTSN